MDIEEVIDHELQIADFEECECGVNKDNSYHRTIATQLQYLLDRWESEEHEDNDL